jgi:hypothetical protein
MAVKTSTLKAVKAAKPLLPPDESMWQKYSPHYEAPLAGATSLFMHGTVIGIIAIAGMAVFWAAREEAARPPRMDVVMIEGGGNGGFEGLSGEAGSPGAPDAGAPKERTEQVAPLDQQPQPDRSVPRLLKDPPLDLGLPLLDTPDAPLNSSLSVELAKLIDDAQAEANKEIKPAVGPANAKKVGKPGTGNPKGKGGLGGPGDGPGRGTKKGSGTGTGGFGGNATKQEVYSWRWAFDPSGDGRQHATKLAAMGVTLVLPDPRGKLWFVTDLNRRPADPRPGVLPNLKETVRWENTKAESIQGLARELQLKFTPTSILLLLPKEQEEKMAAEEQRFARQQGRDLRTVRKTWFDFRLKNGAYEPVGVRFE